MKGVLYYFSGTGNTKWVADKFKEFFNKINIYLELRNIEECENFDIDEFNFLVVGSPVYAETEPKLVDDFIKKIKNKNMKTIVYATQGGKSSSAPCTIGKKLKEKNYNIVIQAAIQMPNNYFFSFGKEPNKDEIKIIMKNSENKVKKIIENFIGNKEIKECNSYMRILVSRICSKGFKKIIPKLSKNITADSNCNKCGLCLRNCPKSNITFENGKANFHSKCILCLRCIHICPLNAVLYKGKKINQTQKSIIKHLEIK